MELEGGDHAGEGAGSGRVEGFVFFGVGGRGLNLDGGAAAVFVGEGALEEPGAGAPIKEAGFGFGGGDRLELGAEEFGPGDFERGAEVFVGLLPAGEVLGIDAEEEGGAVIGPSVQADAGAELSRSSGE